MNTFKHLVLTCFLLVSFFNVNAQNIYAPIGAEWYNEQSHGVFYCHVTGDTVIQGTSCRIIKEEALYNVPPNQHPYYDLWPNTFYVYDSPDTVFIYNNIFQRFTPVFVFNVAAGDTIHLPLTPLQGCRFFNNAMLTDSLFHIVVDSVAMVNYSGSTFKTVYSHIIETNAHYQKWAINNQNIYAEYLGSLTSNILPLCTNCGSCLSEEFTTVPGELRCYHDNEHQINLTSETCDNGATAVTDVLMTNLILEIYPNPANDMISITNKTGHKITGVSLQTITGKRFEIPVTNNQVSLKHFPNGFYFIRIQMNNEYVVAKPVIVNH
ncbi:T9SS type A sorting domain-containing protein [Taibaiella lutea]|uniref:T9SS type A sorting domain-containing protein n=1 Tax=Taibaiella lutea TaxID=2608001 RepID=A0A5M6CB28_9BACT|nr:T9SS type A sorting domain-containing protein [Taibaiella lutea]KAA5532388.1 T9SS type A sorting domain-containing protein [Taibaiella lutea]